MAHLLVNMVRHLQDMVHLLLDNLQVDMVLHHLQDMDLHHQEDTVLHLVSMDHLLQDMDIRDQDMDMEVGNIL